MSPIDKFPMDGVSDVHIHNAVDYLGQANKAIRWTQVSAWTKNILFFAYQNHWVI